MADRGHSHIAESPARAEPGRTSSAATRAEGPTAAEFVASLSREHIRNLLWLQQHEDELAKHEGQWVVIAKQSFYCTGKTQEDVEAQAIRDGLRVGDFIVEYVFPFDVTLVTTPGA